MKGRQQPTYCGRDRLVRLRLPQRKMPINQIKCPGVADVFRIPKLGATFYQSQVSPGVRPVIEPNFTGILDPKRPGVRARMSPFSLTANGSIFLSPIKKSLRLFRITRVFRT